MKNGLNVKSWLAAAMVAALAGSVWGSRCSGVRAVTAGEGGEGGRGAGEGARGAGVGGAG